MDSLKILFLNPDMRACASCGRAGIVAAGISSARIRINELTCAADGRGTTPDLILMRSTRTASLERDLRLLRQHCGQAPVLAMLCGAPHEDDLPDMLELGVDDFVLCPFHEQELAARLRGLLGGRSACTAAGAELQSLAAHGIIGESEVLRKAVRQISSIAQSNATVLITGETGTGKELFARAIHYLSPRSASPFVPVNCGGLPEHLLENELFGHVRGAYTDARSSSPGLLGVANGGTLFLDEVDSLSPVAQVKLLRFLQDREYRLLGSARAVIADVRVLAASNRDLRACIRERSVREDLFHRLNVLSLAIPPLRERIGDVPRLALHFLAKYTAEEHRTPLRIVPEAMEKLALYDWPGNVRELEAVIQRAVVMTGERELHPEHIELPEPLPESLSKTRLREAKAQAINQFERAYLIKLLAAHGGNLSQAAQEAGKDRRSLQRLMRRHALRREDFAPPLARHATSGR